MKSLILDNILFKLQYFGNSSYHYQAKYKSKDKLLLIEYIKTSYINYKEIKWIKLGVSVK